MKTTKLLSLLLAVIICGGCVLGCEQTESDPDATQEMTTATTAEATTLLTTPKVTDESNKPVFPNPIGGGCHIGNLSLKEDEYLTFIENPNEYLASLKSDEEPPAFPEDFVKFDSISQFGDFARLELTTVSMAGDGYYIFDSSSWYYWYSIYKPNANIMPDGTYEGGKTLIRIAHKGHKEYLDYVIPDSDPRKISEVNAEDMSQLSTEESGVYVHSGIRYNYVKGKLFTIEWTVDDVYYSLDVTQEWLEEPIDPSTGLGKLLNLETATELVASMSTSASTAE